MLHGMKFAKIQMAALKGTRYLSMTRYTDARRPDCLEHELTMPTVIFLLIPNVCGLNVEDPGVPWADC